MSELLIEGKALPNQSSDSSNGGVTLAGAGTWNTAGPWVDVSAYPSLTVAAASDVDGTVKVEYSVNGSDIDSTLSFPFIAGQVNKPHRLTNLRKFVRVTYVNGSSAQSYFRLQSMVGAQTQLNSPMNGTITETDDAIVVHALDYEDEVALGRYQGRESFVKFGNLISLDQADGECAVWDLTDGTGAAAWTPQRADEITALETLNIKSSSAEDGAGTTTGLNTLLIRGCGPDYVDQTEIINLNGTGTVTTVNQWLGGVNRLRPVACGSNRKNVGEILVTGNTSGKNVAYMHTNTGVSRQTFLWVPAGKKYVVKGGLVTSQRISGGTDPIVDFRFQVRDLVNQIETEQVLETLDTEVEQRIDSYAPLSMPFTVPEKHLIEITALTTQNNTKCHARLWGKLVTTLG